MKVTSCLVLAGALFCTQAIGQEFNKPDHVKEKTTFASNVCIAKGGIGIITSSLYINLKSAKNELILTAGERWAGQSPMTQEVVTYFDGRIWSSQALPDGFDLSKAIVVSFEKDKVRFFDFGKMSGGYYPRPEDR